MTKIIGHRGAAGLELENTRASFLAAIKHGVDMIELDIRLTADDKLVLSHDPVTNRVSDTNVAIHDKTLRELKTIALHNGEALLSLDEAFKIIGTIPVIVEIKDAGSVDELLLTLGRHPKAKVSVASRLHQELLKIHRVLPDIPTYALEDFDPIEVLRKAHSVHATGIGINKWIMNPLTYYLVQRRGMEMYVYTVNNAFLVRLFKKLYPKLHICTNSPDRYAQSLH